MIFERATATGAGAVRLPHSGEDAACWLGEVVAPEAGANAVQALLVRALHDVFRHGAGRLEASTSSIDLRPLGFTHLPIASTS